VPRIQNRRVLAAVEHGEPDHGRADLPLRMQAAVGQRTPVPDGVADELGKAQLGISHALGRNAQRLELLTEAPPGAPGTFWPVGKGKRGHPWDTPAARESLGEVPGTNRRQTVSAGDEPPVSNGTGSKTSTETSTVVVVDAGIAGVACARALARQGVRVELRERARHAGGRMASPVINGRVTDTGASYFTVSDASAAPDGGSAADGFRAVVDDWVERGFARPWTDRFPVLAGDGLGEPKPGPVRYAAPGGLRALVNDLLERAAHETGDRLLPRFGEEVRAVGPGPTVDGTPVAAVVLAMPDPQALRLLDPALEPERAELGGREWEPVLALVAGWAERTWPELDGAFVADDPVLGWMADDGRRRGDGAPVLVAHSTSPFAAQHLGDPAAAAPEMVAAVDRLLGTGAPGAAQVRRWSYARPSAAREAACHVGAARVGFAGDGWGSAKVQTAYASGEALGRVLAGELGSSAGSTG